MGDPVRVDLADWAHVVSPHVLHLVRRATFGPTPALLASVERVGATAWLRRQLAPAGIPDRRVDALMSRFPELDKPIPDVRAELDFGWDVMFQLTRATICRAVWSERQLFEVMVDFWSNHLNVTCPSSDVWDNRADYDREVIRRHALGTFSDLLVAATMHPAMLRYLDNASSTKWAPNENHGRELLELHTVGCDAGYTETDVRNSALILTGAGVDWKTGLYRYVASRHHTGPVTVLGFEHANASDAGGQDVAVGYLRYLARHPATARTIARKLAVRFVADEPPPSLVAKLAATYLASDTAIVPVLLQLFASAEFAASQGHKARRPYEDVVATLRVLGIGPDASGTKGLEALHWILVDLGMAPLAWSPPNGYPDVAGAWQSAAGTLARWNTHLNIAAGWWPTTLDRPQPATLLPARLPRTHGQLVDALSRRLLFRPASVALQDAVCAFLEVSRRAPLRRDSAAVGWRLPYVVALLLDSPRHSVR